MSADQCLKRELCWHMRQAQYQKMISGDNFQPWTCSHAIKGGDYIDMAAHSHGIDLSTQEVGGVMRHAQPAV